MAFVYILKSQKNGRYYIGSTLDVSERLKKHNSGQVYSTSRLLPLELMLKQEYASVALARKAELKLKKLKRRDYVERIIRDGFIKILS